MIRTLGCDGGKADLFAPYSATPGDRRLIHFCRHTRVEKTESASLTYAASQRRILPIAWLDHRTLTLGLEGKSPVGLVFLQQSQASGNTKLMPLDVWQLSLQGGGRGMGVRGLASRC